MARGKTQAKALIICPDRVPAAEFITRDRKKINDAVDLGYRRAEELKDDIRAFMTGEGSLS